MFTVANPVVNAKTDPAITSTFISANPNSDRAHRAGVDPGRVRHDGVRADRGVPRRVLSGTDPITSLSIPITSATGGSVASCRSSLRACSRQPATSMPAGLPDRRGAHDGVHRLAVRRGNEGGRSLGRGRRPGRERPEGDGDRRDLTPVGARAELGSRVGSLAPAAKTPRLPFARRCAPSVALSVSRPPLRVAVLGAGTVGGAVLDSDARSSRSAGDRRRGDVTLAAVAVRDLDRARGDGTAETC